MDAASKISQELLSSCRTRMLKRPITQLCKREDKPERGNRAYQRQLRKMLAEKFRTQAGYRQIIDGFA